MIKSDDRMSSIDITNTSSSYFSLLLMLFQIYLLIFVPCPCCSSPFTRIKTNAQFLFAPFPIMMLIDIDWSSLPQNLFAFQLSQRLSIPTCKYSFEINCSGMKESLQCCGQYPNEQTDNCWEKRTRHIAELATLCEYPNNTLSLPSFKLTCCWPRQYCSPIYRASLHSSVHYDHRDICQLHKGRSGDLL